MLFLCFHMVIMLLAYYKIMTQKTSICPPHETVKNFKAKSGCLRLYFKGGKQCSFHKNIITCFWVIKIICKYYLVLTLIVFTSICELKIKQDSPSTQILLTGIAAKSNYEWYSSKNKYLPFIISSFFCKFFLEREHYPWESERLCNCRYLSMIYLLMPLLRRWINYGIGFVHHSNSLHSLAQF